MTSPSSGEPAGEPRARHPHRNEPSAERSRGGPPDDVRPEAYDYAESALGGADSVQKTSYVGGEGTEPAGAPTAGVIARTSSGGGINVGAWIVGLVALAIALVYGFGIFT
jgi:hypothetical protein